MHLKVIDVGWHRAPNLWSILFFPFSLAFVCVVQRPTWTGSPFHYGDGRQSMSTLFSIHTQEQDTIRYRGWWTCLASHIWYNIKKMSSRYWIELNCTYNSINNFIFKCTFVINKKTTYTNMHWSIVQSCVNILLPVVVAAAVVDVVVVVGFNKITQYIM